MDWRGGPVPWPPRSPDVSSHDYFLWGHLKTLVYASPVDQDEDLVARINVAAARCVKYLECLKVYANRSIDAVKHVSLLVDAILNSYCKHCTCQRRCQ
ncbi:hypothetical protein AVEN_94179-1 [Araneus ventricosus]|uniref:Uncharacterized protein n=1 Tax=Araneus ventricosus TaxID=182803 RepID=A0A4Y2IW43_ARAVE|nr:hypothetical protein AVEN_94179-1 [Araneus ventricosus]